MKMTLLTFSPELTLAERRKICRILDTNMLSDIFEHIDQKQAAEYLDEMDIKRLLLSFLPWKQTLLWMY